MSANRPDSDAQAFIEAIERCEQRANEQAAFVKKLKSRLSRAKKALATKPAIAAEVSKLASDLRRMDAEPDRVSPSQLIDELDKGLHRLEARRRESFPVELREACESARMDFAPLPDGFSVGPFLVGTDWGKETATLQYAKLDVLKKAPLNPQSLVELAKVLKAAVVDEPVDFDRFSEELHEAMRVALARQNKPARSDLRVELPLVYQEMVLIRQASRKARAQGEYPLPRFVVELKQFIQSDQNMEAERQFRPETAVIENTKNPKKSVFIPRDLNRGFGEGTYYQALTYG